MVATNTGMVWVGAAAMGWDMLAAVMVTAAAAVPITRVVVAVVVVVVVVVLVNRTNAPAAVGSTAPHHMVEVDV